MSTPARLVWERSDGRSVEFPLEGEVFDVGRDQEAAIRIDEPLVSRRHARIERRGDGWIVADLGSTNFTRLNGQRVRRECELADGDELHFARAKCSFFLPGGAAPHPPACPAPNGSGGDPPLAPPE